MLEIFDSHVHTNHSFDCKADSIEVCENAINKKLKGISITDHFEVGGNREKIFIEEISASIKTSQHLNKIYSGKLLVSTGIEIGQPHHNAEETATAMQMFDYDFVLASCHIIRGYADFCDFKPEPDKVDIILNQYFEEILEMISSQDFDSLAHLTYPLRYIQGVHKINVNINNFNKIIDSILTKLIQTNKSLEINTYAKRQSLNDYTPSFDIVKRYKELGGELITIGSDAHIPKDVGSDLINVIDNLRLLGFTEYVYYLNRLPIKILINPIKGN